MKSKYPLLKLLIYITIGYILGYLFLSNIYLILFLSILSILITFISILPNYIKYALISLIIGINLNSSIDIYRFKSLENNIANSFEGLYNAEIKEVLNTNNQYSRFVAEGLIHSSIFTKPHKCQSIVTLFDSNNKFEIKPGIKFLANSRFKVGAPKILREDFDEQTFLISKNSFFFVSVAAKDFSIREDNYNFYTFLFDTKESIKQRIIDIVQDSNIADILTAITTGDKSGIDRITKEIFSLTGTAHVLAISGLHVGIFSLFIYTLIGFLKNRFVKLFVFIILVWAFIIFTGGQPSAVRAAIMATFTAFLIYYGKVPNPINILLFTILLFVIIDPTVIYSVSFQLSIFAISGIILLYKPIYSTIINLFIKETVVTRIVSSSLAISFAATIPTSIITSYYFDTFSIVYPIANLLVLPLMVVSSFQCTFFVLFSSFGIPFSDSFINAAYFLTDITLDINKYLAGIGSNFIGNRDDLLLLSIVSSILLLYLFLSINIRRFIFRFLISSIILILFLEIKFNEYESVTIIPREQHTSVLLEDDKTINLIIADRKKYDYFNYDYALANYLKKRDKKIRIIKTGNVSINFEDNLTKDKIYDSKFIGLVQLDKLSNKIGYKNIYRIDKRVD